MKHLYLLLSVIAITLSLTSCGTAHFMSNRKPQEIDKVLLLRPLTKISIIGQGNKGEYNEAYSNEMMMDITESLEKHLPLNIKKQRLVTDDSTQIEIDNQIYALATRVQQSGTIVGIQLSDNLVELLEKNGQNYAIGTLGLGFTRQKGNYGKEVAKGIGIGILTLGLFVPVPVKASSTIIFFLLDKQQKNIALYQTSIGQDREPIKKEVIDKQIATLLHDYFYPRATSNN